MKSFDVLLALVLPGLILLHLLVAPYTKVEESFTLQAAHDILAYGTPTSNINARFHALYDHFTFPGAVPRSFVGPVLLSGFSQPLVALFGFAHAQIIVRAVLGLFNAVSLNFFASRLRVGLGRDVSRWWILLTAGQFHVIFYASRTLPNMFAFGATTIASALLLPNPDARAQEGRQRVAISVLVFAAVIFRSEVALLLGTTGLYLLLTRRITIAQIIPPFVISLIAALVLSVPIDSYFWQKPLWPELWGFAYNVLHGGASNWGTSPWHYYFISALPRLLLNPITVILIPLAVTHPATARTARDLIIPPLLFVAIYSFQPHKEARFIFYAVPPLTAAAAQGASLVFTRRVKRPVYAISSLVIALSIPACLAAATGILLLSSLNYPGGEAITALQGLTPASGVSAVHTDVLSCMTGVTLFLQKRTPDLAFDKTEEPSVLRSSAFWSKFDYLMMEDPTKIPGGGSEWEVLGTIHGYSGIEMLRPQATDPEQAGAKPTDKEAMKVLGKGRLLSNIRTKVRSVTGGWWLGPRMEPRVHILRRDPTKARVVEVTREGPKPRA